MTNLQSIFQRGAVTSSVCKQIKRWVRGFTRQDLEFFACYHPTEPWKKLADICHLSPKKVGYVVNQSDIPDREDGPVGDSPNQGLSVKPREFVSKACLFYVTLIQRSFGKARS